MTELIDYNRVDLPRFEEQQKEKAKKEKAVLVLSDDLVGKEKHEEDKGNYKYSKNR